MAPDDKAGGITVTAKAGDSTQKDQRKHVDSGASLPRFEPRLLKILAV